MINKIARNILLFNRAKFFVPKVQTRTFTHSLCKRHVERPTCLSISQYILVPRSNFCKKPDNNDKSKGEKSEKNSTEEYTPESDEELQEYLKKIHEDFTFGTSQVEKSPPKEEHVKKVDDSNNLKSALQDKYKVFSDDDFEVILSYEEQKYRYEEKYNQEEVPEYTLYRPKKSVKQYDNKRGKEGVFDLEDFVAILKQEKVKDLAVIQVPKERHYGSYLVIGTGASKRHLGATIEFINKLYKARKHDKDPFIKIEGKKCEDWKVLNMGNIVFHLFQEETRLLYDLEALWTLGPDHDPHCSISQSDDSLESLLEPHLQFLDQATPRQ